MKRFQTNDIFRSLKIVWNCSPKWTLVNAAVVVVKGIVPLMLIFIIQYLVDGVSILALQANTKDVYLTLVNILLFAGGVFVLNAVLNSVSGIIREKHSFFITDAVQNMIHERTTSLNFVNYDDYNFQNIYYRAINEANYRPSKIYYGFIGLVQNVITLALIASLLASLHWFMLVGLILISIPVVIIRLNFSQKIYAFQREHTEEERYVNYYNRLLTGKEFAKELRIFNLSKLFKQRFEESKVDLRVKHFGMLKLKTKYELLLQIIMALALISVFGYISFQAVNGNLTQGQMVMFFLALYRGYSFLQDLLSQISGLYEDGLFLKNLFEFMDHKELRKKQSRSAVFPVPLKTGIIIEKVFFKYPNSSRHVFKNLNLNINKGETIALVGANGAGKSTLVKLLCGLYEPDKGSIRADGVDISTVSQQSISENVSAVFQDFMLYNFSAKENIWLGNISKSQNDEAIVESAQKSGVNDLIQELPKGYETTLGTLFKDSEMLSVGEWQRIALSRSFFNDAQMVILDEPTSSMDAFTETNLIENFKAITKGRTAIIVSHRMSTIHLADRIIVLDDFGVAEEGTPEELLKKKGHFYQMVESIGR
ncbi:ABC transporter ATP-binding protein [Labilibacter marinus]|uniref:ABC transporter ATP-binding protein n=1 Tax=Labilibacter marinus TaxID=1477105 RepID=UPI001E5EE6A4|nr:ABC transporter ATP-binding protein [Labilibacter marinus]